MASPPKKLKNWEELINDGQNYGDEGKDFSPFEKAVFESIKDKKVLKIQDSFLFVKTGHDAENPDHPVQLATMLAAFEPLNIITSLIITHNRFNAEALKILVDSPILNNIDYLHLGSNELGDEGAKIVASHPCSPKSTP